jgi:hypothetical protein
VTERNVSGLIWVYTCREQYTTETLTVEGEGNGKRA